MAQRLIAAGHQVTIVCGSYANGTTGISAPFKGSSRKGIVDGINIIEFDLSYGNKDGFVKRGFTFLNFAMRSVMVALREPCDIVFATTTPLTAGIAGIFAKGLRRKPFVFEVRDLWPELPRAMKVITNPILLWTMGALEWASYKSADRLIGLSPGIVDGISRYVDRDTIELIPNGCDINLFAGDIAPWRPKQVSSDDFMAVFTGTHGKANGLNAIIDAAIILKERKAGNIKFLLIGDGSEKAALMKRADDKGLNDIVIFHDPIAKTKLSGLMASADVGLQILANIPAFYYGTSPNKFFDYLAAGLPVLTNYPGWVADMIKDNDCGMAVQPDNALAFADALIAMQNSSRKKDMAHNAHALAKREFSRDKLGEKFVKWVIGASEAKP